MNSDSATTMSFLAQTRSLLLPTAAASVLAIGGQAHANGGGRAFFATCETDEPLIAVQRQPSRALPARADVLYVHGATFGADLSIFFRFDGVSWADRLADAGFSVWGFDFVGYGSSARYATERGGPAGALDEQLRDLERVIALVRRHNGDRPVVLLAHSHGGVVAARYAGDHPDDVAALVLFAPIVLRPQAALPRTNGAAVPSHYPLTAWAQYRRFIEDVPRDQPQVLAEADMHAWSAAFLASDPTSATRTPPSVMTPYGPVADIAALWSGRALYDPARIRVSTLLVRGEWDSACNDADAGRLLAGLDVPVKRDVKIERATHLMHLERQRVALHAEVNRFLQEVLPASPGAIP